MRIVIFKGNRDLILSINKRTKFKEETDQLCSFNRNPEQLCALIKNIRDKGVNPYSVLFW